MSLKTVKKVKNTLQIKRVPISINYNLRDPISYKNRVIYIETEPVELRIEKRTVIISFNILPLGKDEVVLKIP